MKRTYKLFFISLRGPQHNINEAGVKKYGFMLVELIIAILIASMIGGILLTALFQSNKVQVIVDDIIDISERVGIVANQLEKDLAGAFVPVQAEKENVQGTEKPDESGDEKKSPDKKDEADQKTAQKKEQKPIEKIFYSTNKEGMLDTLSFVTNNPLVVFVGKDVGVVKPKVVRVQYTLKPEQDKKASYALFRQESNELDLAEYKNVRPYEVIGGIKKLNVNFTARIEKKQEQKAGQQSQEKEKISYEYKVMPDWISEQKKDATQGKEGDTKEPEFPRIPYAVEFKITLWDKQNQKDKEFTVVCEIPVDSIQAKKEEKQKPEPAQKDEQEAKTDTSQQSRQQQDQWSKATHSRQSQQSQEVVVYNGIETLSNALDSLKKLLGHV